jgi:hypothetical protein
MDFDVLILAHSNWKRRFHEHLRGKDRLDLETVRDVTRCNMGQWLCGAGREYADSREYQDLATKHARFHTLAAAALEQADKLSDSEALKLVATDSDFERASRQCISAIWTMADRVAKKT